MGRIAEEDAALASERRRPLMKYGNSPCKDCPRRIVAEGGGKACEAGCVEWQAYIKEREETAEKVKQQKQTMNYYLQIQNEFYERRRRKYGR